MSLPFLLPRWTSLLLALLPVLGLVGGGANSASAEAAGMPQNATALLRKLATLPGLEARFREEKKLALLRAPLVNEGRLYYMPPGYLLRRVERPDASSVRITPQQLVMRDSSGKKTIDLRSRPAVKLFVESFTRVLSGDHAALKRIYRVRFTPAETPSDTWSLKLLPKGPPLSELVQSVTMSGKGYAVHTIHVLEGNGDFSETRLFDVDPQRRFSANERRELFGLEPQQP